MSQQFKAWRAGGLRASKRSKSDTSLPVVSLDPVIPDYYFLLFFLQNKINKNNLKLFFLFFGEEMSFLYKDAIGCVG